MSDETQSALRQAFDAIEAGDLETARTILEPVLAAEPDNADAWWVFSHAVTDPQEALDALENVVRVDPQYPGATELLTTLRDRLPRRQAPPPPPPPIDIPDLPGDEPDFALPPSSAPAQPEEEESRSRLIPILAGVLLIVVIIALAYSLISRSQTPPVTPTVVALATLPPVDTTPLAVTEEATLDATAEAAAATEAPIAEVTEAAAATSEAVATESVLSGAATEAPTAEVVALDATPTAEVLATEVVSPAATEALVALSAAEQSLLAGLGRYTLAAEPLVRQSTTVGDALLAGVCVNDRREVPTLLRPIMRALANSTAALPEDVQAVGVRMLDCNTGRAFVVMAVDRQSALDHAAGTLPYVDFRQRWQPQR